MTVEKVTRQGEGPLSSEATAHAATQAQQFLNFALALEDHPFPTAPEQQREALWALVRLCVRHRQAELLAAPVLDSASVDESDPFAGLFHGALDESGNTYSDLGLPVEPSGTVRLADGLILTAPWEPERYARALLRSGPGWYGSVWEQQPDQDGVFYLPWRLYCTGNGNHSPASGILWGDGEIAPQDAVDLSEVLRRVRLSDHGVVREDSGELVGVSEHWSVLALVGLGKLLLELER